VSDRLSASIICDTFHLPPDLVKVILRMKGIERTILITDAVHVATLPPGKYSLVGTPIELQASGKVIKLGDSCLAGSALSMNRAVPLFMRQSDAPLPEALRAATMNPATLLSRAGLCREIAPGEPASLISFRFTPDALDIQTVCLAGEKVYSGASAAA
jgi:N-acetylglucosamine-6-phosphate deacetylase